MKIFKQLIIVIVLTLFANSVKTQIIDRYGIRAGIGISNRGQTNTGSKIDWYDSRTGFSAYVNAEKSFSKYIALRTELGYIRKSSYVSDKFPIYETDQIIGYGPLLFDFHYLSLAIDTKLNYFDTKFSPYLLVGVNVDYLIKTDLEAQNLNDYWIEYINNDMYNQENKFILVGQLGIGCVYNDTFYLEIEYKPAITNCKRIDNFGGVKNMYLGLSLGLNISELMNVN